MTRTSPVEPPAAPLTDDTIALRLRLESDVDAIAEASHDSETQRWMDDAPMDDATRRTSMERVREVWLSGKAAPFVIADAVTDRPLGLINLQFRSDTLATIAYSVFPAARGRGVAARAVALLARWAGPIGVREVRLEIKEGNAASIRVAEKCGFRRITVEDGMIVYAAPSTQ